VRRTDYFDQVMENDFWPGDILKRHDQRGIPASNTKGVSGAYQMVVVVHTHPFITMALGGERVLWYLDKKDLTLQNPERVESVEYRRMTEKNFTDAHPDGRLTPKIFSPETTITIQPPLMLADYFNFSTEHHQSFKTIHNYSLLNGSNVEMYVEQPMALRMHLPKRTLRGVMYGTDYAGYYLLIVEYPKDTRRDLNGMQDHALLFRYNSIYGQYVDLDEAKGLRDLPLAKKPLHEPTYSNYWTTAQNKVYS